MWPPAVIAHHAIVFGALAAAAARLRRDISLELGLFLVGLPILGIFSMPASWLLLERWKWALVPQLQPMRSLLFVSLSMVILTTAAGLRASTNRQRWEAAGWFTLAFVLPLDSLLFGPLPWRRALLAVVLGVVTAGLVRASELRAGRLAPAAALAPLLAFFAIPAFGDVENYPDLHTAGLRELSEWARTSTAQDAVFLFPDAGRSLEPGMFRSDALRAVYVDWKGGGQVNFLRSLGERWWERWQKTMAPRFRPALLAGYRGLGIDYVVLRPEHRLGRKPVFENRQFVAYAVE
jgi:hypothetical protein